MSDPILNFVRCQWCGGNAGGPSHQCTEEGKRAAEEYAAKGVALMIKAAELQERVDGLTGRQSTSTTNSQLTRLLMECEEALRTTEARAEKGEAERDEMQAELRELLKATIPMTTVDEDGKVWRVEQCGRWVYSPTEDAVCWRSWGHGDDRQVYVLVPIEDGAS